MKTTTGTQLTTQRRRRPFLLLLAALFGLGAALLGLGWLSGIRAVYLEHVIATFEFRGLHSQAEAASLVHQFSLGRPVRQSALARRSVTDDIWIARLQFQADDPAAAREQVRKWMQGVAAPVEVRLIKAEFYPVRLYRPRRGDIVFGAPRPISNATSKAARFHPRVVASKKAAGVLFLDSCRIPWETLNAKDSHPLAGHVVTATGQFFWGDEAGLNYRECAYDLMSQPGFPWQTSACWGKLIFSDHGNSFTANVVNDIPNESRLEPAEWGNARVE
ncbi:MAG: hypothetical protein AB9869_12770 [Verrucomicrobiia bacterium]